MNKHVRTLCLAIAAAGMLGLLSFSGRKNRDNDTYQFPYQQAGLTKEQAAAHLVGRFTYGVTTAEVNRAMQMGLENWFQQQLEARQPDDALNQMLDRYDALKMDNTAIASTYPRGGQLIRMAVKDGVVDKDSVKTDRKAYKDVLQAYMQDKGYRPEKELLHQLYSQKILRACYSNNQLQEVMTGFWFNHFNVSVTKNDCAPFILSYERDVIRPNALGKFNDLLLATAQSQAMLYYLDNFSSAAPDRNPAKNQPMQREVMMQDGNDAAMDNNIAPPKPKKVQGLNENYAREVMELHTLGVDGGYTQQDVTQAARVLTGWTVYPMGEKKQALEERLEKLGPEKAERQGFVHTGDFLFTPNRHDKGVKTVLGQQFGPDGGYQEGVQLLYMLAHHPSTAHFICKKLAVHFVSDNPSQQLVDKMAQTFLSTDGDIRKVLITMICSPEFWSTTAVREKTKSPFELAIGTARSLNATIDNPMPLYNWIGKMGEKMYAYQAPTGFPDNGNYWINTGSLLNRMNFGMALAYNRIGGINVNHDQGTVEGRSENTKMALKKYCTLMMPGRNTDETIKRLTPLLNNPEQLQKAMSVNDDRTQNTAMNRAVNTQGRNSMQAQVVGIIIGSPEYQRR